MAFGILRLRNFILVTSTEEGKEGEENGDDDGMIQQKFLNYCMSLPFRF
jgi:hypothetical protein